MMKPKTLKSMPKEDTSDWSLGHQMAAITIAAALMSYSPLELNEIGELILDWKKRKEISNENIE